MNRQFVISVVVLFALSMALGFIVHGVFLGKEYAKLVPGLFRSPESAEHYFPFMIAAHIALAFGITWIYRQGREAKPVLGQGLRFGLALALVMPVATYLIYYAVQPMPSDLVAQQIAFDAVAMVILGLAAAALNRTS
jgi:magnesium-transporting ATPase (P-type)